VPADRNESTIVDGHEDPRLLGHRGAFLALSPDVP
jgi:hypothetical protein